MQITIQQLIDTHIKTLRSIDEVEQVARAMEARRAELAANQRIAVRPELSSSARRVPIVSKTRVQRGIVYGGQETGMFAEFGINHEGRNTIHLTGRYGNFTDVDREFAEGDVCAYGSFNFDFLGTIERITQKTIKIKEDHGGRIHQLDLATFANRNYKFDLEKSRAKRASWYD